MIYIGTAEADGSAIYFDIHAAERQGRGLCFSGTVGDGCYEGEVLVEVGRNEEVTFVDAWLGGSGFSDFIARCGTEILKSSLLEVAREMSPFRMRCTAAHGKVQPHGEAVVAETPPVWVKSA